MQLNKYKKGIILAGGKGSRLFPITKIISKQLLPIYDKPMIFYPLSLLMLLKIREILIITNSENINLYKKLLGDGRYIGMKISFKIQKSPDGIAEAINIGNKFIKDDNFCLILGDNFFYGDSLIKDIFTFISNSKPFVILKEVLNPERYGVAKFDRSGKLVDIIEKPKKYISNFAVTGFYFYDNNAKKLVKKIKKSKRGELEITDLNKIYIKNNDLSFLKLGAGTTWFDAGTYDSYLNVSQFVSSIQNRNNEKIGCIEEIAFLNNWINKKKFNIICQRYKDSEYYNYLKKAFLR
jgi:glucose-1-phosphate thymidylyltransferase